MGTERWDWGVFPNADGVVRTFETLTPLFKASQHRMNAPGRIGLV